MTANTILTAEAFDGTAALETRRQPHLVLIEGGRGHVREERRPQPSRLSLGQYLCALGCVALLVGALCVASLVSDALGVGSRAQALSQLPEATVVVQDGDTLWGIAESLGVDVPTRELVSWITERNDVSAAIVAGQTLVVPVPGA